MLDQLPHLEPNSDAFNSLVAGQGLVGVSGTSTKHVVSGGEVVDLAANNCFSIIFKVHN